MHSVQSNNKNKLLTSKEKKLSWYQKCIKWVGNGFYQDEYVKDYLKSQIRDSFTFHLKLLSKKILSITSCIAIILGVGLFTQQKNIQRLSKKYLAARPEIKDVLGASTSKIKLSGSVIFRTPVTLQN